MQGDSYNKVSSGDSKLLKHTKHLKMFKFTFKQCSLNSEEMLITNDLHDFYVTSSHFIALKIWGDF